MLVLVPVLVLLGLAVGSFLNVVVWRVPRHESIGVPQILGTRHKDEHCSRSSGDVAVEVVPKPLGLWGPLSRKWRIDEKDGRGDLGIRPGLASNAPLPKPIGDSLDGKAHPTARASPSPGPTGVSTV